MDGMRLRFLLITLSSLLIFGACSSDTYDFIITSSDPDAVNIENIVTPNDPDNHVHSELKQPIDKDFLILFYINGDTPFNDYAFYQMAQIGKGLRTVRRYDGETPKKSYNNITALGLWDGYDKDATFTPNHYYPYTYLLEFTYPPQQYTREIATDMKNFTIDHSNEIMKSENNWLTEIQEANLADYKTLKEFMSWSLSKYNSDNSKQVILFIVGTPGGSFGNETGSYIPPSARSTCRDYSNESFYLSANDIKKALNQNGFTSSNKMPLLVIDSGLCASLEDSFELRDCVRSLLTCPSPAPAGGIDLNYFLSTLTKGTSIYEIGNKNVNIYANRNYMNQYTSDGMASISFIDLTTVETLGKNVNLLANSIISRKDNKDIDNKYSIFDLMYNTTLKKGFLYFDDKAVDGITDEGMYYKALYQHKIPNTEYFTGYFYQFDLSYLAHTIQRKAEQNGIEEIYYYSNQIIENLKEIIISSWRNETNSKSGLYPVLNEKFHEKTPIQFGMTITGPARTQYSDPVSGYIYLQPYNFSDFEYKNYKYNNKSTWKNMLELLFPDQFKENTYIYYK